MMGSELLCCGESVVDVLIIGAGLSGLRAAVELHKAGLKIAVLERNNHVGGLCHSASTHDTARITSIGDTHTEMLSLAKDFQIDLVKQHRKGLSLQQRYDWIHDGPRVTENIPALEKVVWPPEDSQLSFRSLIEDPAIQRFYRRISDLSKTWHGPDALLLDAVSFLQLVEANFLHSKVVTHEAHFLTSFLLGVHPARVSALYVLDHIASGGGLANLYFHPESPGGGAHHLRAPQGPQAFTNNLVDLLPNGTIHLSAVVNKISQNNNTDRENAHHPSYPCIIEATLYPSTITKAFHAKKVLLTTLPAFYSPLFSHCPGNIRLQPPLPLHKLASVNRHSVNHAEFATVTFYFTQPWWREAGLSGSLDCRVTKELDGPISWVRDTSEEDAVKKKVWTLTCWCAAEKGKEVWDWIRSTYSADDLIEDQKEGWDANPVWMHLQRVFGERMDALNMKIPLPRRRRASSGRQEGKGGEKERKKEKEQEEQDEDADEELVSFTFRNWNGIGIPAPSTLPKEGKEVEELLRTWRYEGPGKGDAVMREPFGNVHFAGTEIAEEWRGFMEGAARSGVRGAREVIEALKKGKNQKDGGKAHL